MNTTRILAFYAFSPLATDRVQILRDELYSIGVEKGIRGLVLLATEGINGTVCGSPDAIGKWRGRIDELFPHATWNESVAGEYVFPRWLVKIREEIVALNMPESSKIEGTHVSPTEWNAMMNEEDVVVIDARNTYETNIGMFENAVDPKTKNFQEFTAFAQSCDLPKDKKVMLYCTGGIRCEKATKAMRDAGFQNVFQLQGGILGYLKQFPDAKFRGECFVFDHRVAVDQRLQPSQTYSLCPSCGDPAKEPCTCVQCGASYAMCEPCRSMKEHACSKNCLYHVRRKKVVTGARRS